MTDERAVTLASRLRGQSPQGATGELLRHLLAGLAAGLPPEAVGHAKGLAVGDGGRWAGSVPVPVLGDQAHVRPLEPVPEAPETEHAAAVPAAPVCQPGEVLVDLVQVVVGTDVEHLERALTRALGVIRRELRVELTRE